MSKKMKNSWKGLKDRSIGSARPPGAGFKFQGLSFKEEGQLSRFHSFNWFNQFAIKRGV
jgi:hypothetical protein